MPRKRPKPTHNHADKSTFEARIQEIVQIKLDGAQRWDILQYVAEKTATGADGKPPQEPWKTRRAIAERTVDNYIAEANRRIVAALRAMEPDHFAQGLMKRHALYARAVNSGDINAALSILKDLSALKDEYPAKKIDAKIETNAIEVIGVKTFFRKLDPVGSAGADGTPAAGPE